MLLTPRDIERIRRLRLVATRPVLGGLFWQLQSRRQLMEDWLYAGLADDELVQWQLGIDND